MTFSQDQAVLYIARQIDKSTVSPKSLESVADHIRDKHCAEALRQTARDLALGKPILKALVARRPFPAAYIAALGAGGSRSVAAVTLPVRDVRDYHRAIRSGLTRVFTMTFFVMAAVALGAHTVLPKIQSFLTESGSGSPALFELSSNALRLLAGPVGLLVFVLLLVLAWRRPDVFLPVTGRLRLSPYQAAALRTLTLMLKAGFPAHEALAFAASTCSHKGLEKDLLTSSKLVEGGRTLAEAVADTRLAPPEFSALWDMGHKGNAAAVVSAGLADLASVESQTQREQVQDRFRVLYSVVCGAFVLWAALTIGWGLMEVLSWLSSY